MNNPGMLRRSWRAWLSHGSPRVGPWWVEYAWTVVFCLVVAIGFTLAAMLIGAGRGDWRSLPDWWAWYQINVTISLCIGFAVRILLTVSTASIGRDRLARARSWQRSLFYLVVPMLGVAVGWPLGLLWAMGVDVRSFVTIGQPRLFAGSVLVALLVAVVFQQFFWTRSRQIRAENEAAEAQLRLLQAQIEPHFLFNTLANVTSLMEADPARAKEMLESFVDYLRASMAGLGRQGRTLGDEIALVESYMRIVKIRMEERLDYTIDVAPALRTLPLPALTLQPLVENAIVHGLEPRIEGGTVRIAARSDGRTLVISVDDDGGGLDAAAPGARQGGSGTALANIRQRLSQTYGSAASLRLEPAAPHGVRASLSLPLAGPLVGAA